MRNIAPIHDQVLIQQDPCETRSKSGLYYPEGSENWNSTGTVLRVGPGAIARDGSRIEPDVRVGDRVVFTRKPGSALLPDRREDDVNGWKDLLMLRETDIIGVLVD